MSWKRVLRSHSTPDSRYDTRDQPVSSPSTTDAGHVAPGTTDTDVFLSFLEGGIPKDEAHH